ncbi:MAG: hypothetical protein KAJ10_11560 [Thermodesulfovibrionia bacterium]|nr:hypothetical protein [Thermodesulfovibrionia bacterium]
MIFQQYEPNANDRMFCVGDLTDRGTESHRAISFLKADWFIPVMGNHVVMKPHSTGTTRTAVDNGSGINHRIE